MRRPDTTTRDRALRRARRLRWVVAFAAAGASVVGTAMARATFQGHNKKRAAAATTVRPRPAKRVVSALPTRAMPNDVPLPPHTSAPPAPAPSATPSPAAPAPAAPAPAPEPVVSGGS